MISWLFPIIGYNWFNPEYIYILWCKLINIVFNSAKAVHPNRKCYKMVFGNSINIIIFLQNKLKDDLKSILL